VGSFETDRLDDESRGFLDYYELHRVIPVSQAHVPIDTYRRQRLHLYRMLGLPPVAFRKARVLEIGPGTGSNAVFIDSLRPASLHLLDANPASIESIESRLGTGELDPERVSIIASDLHADHPELGEYDIVLAEGCLPMQFNPSKSLQSITRFVSQDGGALVITCAEHVGALSEVCRRLLKPAFLAHSQGDFERSVRLAGQYFAPDLLTLPAITRTPRDWVIDQIFHPWPDNWALDIGRVLRLLPDFDYLGSSPSFFVDWRWYKQFGDPMQNAREHAMAQWETAPPMLLDCRIPPFRTHTANLAYSSEIRRLATSFNHEVEIAWRSNSYANEADLRSTISELLAVLAQSQLLVGTRRALNEFARELPRLIDGDFTGEIPEFRSWWGRGQQYLSVMRDPRPHR
jgi:SAM-dependent methyltransferase